MPEEDDDYMTFIPTDPTPTTKETSIQRRARLKREAEARSRPKPLSERLADSAAVRDAALSTSLDTSNKGFQMMAKLGYKAGSTLGKSADARAEPLGVVIKEDRGGIGLDSEKKRKFREEVEGEAKRVKVEEGDYRERLRVEREEKRMEGQVVGAMKVAERLEAEGVDGAEGIGGQSNGEQVNGGKKEEDAADGADGEAATGVKKAEHVHKPLKSVNVLWRGLLRHQLEKERERRMRYDLHQSLSRLPTYEDPDEDEDDKRALGKDKTAVYEEELEDEDPELEAFNALPVAERLEKLVRHLRDTHHYCFWCKYQYSDADMEGCPGITEEDHD
ncbi:hypothetical protein H2199_001215 [Coniosporium tulheliwenetii]|uniref:Uncharacterized protein n=1 Tax=Coniosporium tulheliwenetii TaxID=3383036 RepID=A0ACC2ZLW7_9PEZI|nr:hypothetical protein H2199_001215 [Cladosporium sp. JES 115]